MCRKVDESIDHVVSVCSKLAQKEYKRRHDNLAKIVHWKLARNAVSRSRNNYQKSYHSALAFSARES